MMDCKAHGSWDPKRESGCPECVVLLRAVAEAATEEVVFTYSHPMAADRGHVWTDYEKTPKFYKAMKAYWQALEKASGPIPEKSKRKKS